MSFRPEAWSAEALRVLAPAQLHDTSGGMDSLEDMARAELPLLVARDAAGEALAAYVVSWNPHALNLHVCAAGALPGTAGMTAAMDADLQARALRLGAQWVSCYTRRGGLVRRLTRAGWGVHGVILRRLVRAAQ